MRVTRDGLRELSIDDIRNNIKRYEKYAKPEFHIPSIPINLNLVLNLIKVNFFAS